MSEKNAHRIKRVDLATSAVSVLAGTGNRGAVDGAPPLAAPSFRYPIALALTSDDSTVFVADNWNHKLRSIELRSGRTHTVAGTGEPGAVNGPTLTASFRYPTGVAVSRDGSSVFVSDLNHLIRRVHLPTGIVSTLAGRVGVAGADDGDTTAATFNNPAGLVATLDGSALLVADRFNHKLRRVQISTGFVTTLAGSGQRGSANGAALVSTFAEPSALALTRGGEVLYIADRANRKIRMLIMSTGVVSDVAGSGLQGVRDGPAALARFDTPSGLAVSSNSERLYISGGDADPNVRLIFAARPPPSLPPPPTIPPSSPPYIPPPPYHPGIGFRPTTLVGTIAGRRRDTWVCGRYKYHCTLQSSVWPRYEPSR